MANTKKEKGRWELPAPPDFAIERVVAVRGHIRGIWRFYPTVAGGTVWHNFMGWIPVGDPFNHNLGSKLHLNEAMLFAVPRSMSQYAVCYLQDLAFDNKNEVLQYAKEHKFRQVEDFKLEAA